MMRLYHHISYIYNIYVIIFDVKGGHRAFCHLISASVQYHMFHVGGPPSDQVIDGT